MLLINSSAGILSEDNRQGGAYVPVDVDGSRVIDMDHGALASGCEVGSPWVIHLREFDSASARELFTEPVDGFFAYSPVVHSVTPLPRFPVR